MHVILASVGTDGDVYPYVGLGRALCANGHEVTLATNEHYQSLAAENDFKFQVLMTDAETQAVLSHPDVWNPIKSAVIGSRLLAQIIPRQYDTLAALADKPDVVIVASPIVLAARVIQEHFNIPTVTLILQPWVIPSLTAPPKMPGGMSLPRWVPRMGGKLYWRLVDGAGSYLVCGALNQLLRSLDLPPVKRLFQWWFSPDLVIGMFPAQYAQPQDDWPAQIQLAGFPMFDGRAESSLAPEVSKYLETIAESPIAFTLGTGMMHARRFFEVAVDACRRLDMHGILLTKHVDQLPSELPSIVQHFRFAPFQTLFPRCAAVVHHGGIGTVAKALVAGTPQLVVPLAFDQPDNAARLVQLRTGRTLRRLGRNGKRMAEHLAYLTTQDFRERCASVATRFQAVDGIDVAVQSIEEFVRRGDQSAAETRTDETNSLI